MSTALEFHIGGKSGCERPRKEETNASQSVASIAPSPKGMQTRSRTTQNKAK